MPSAAKRYSWGIAACIIVIAGVAGAVVWNSRDPFRSSARRAWRDQAVISIQHRLDDKKWLDSEIKQRTAIARSQEGGWIGDELLLMRNGDWVICRSVCTKEQASAVKKDLFIGRGSDGKWYYSTFHFCVGLCTLHMEDRPASLAQFVDGYWLAEFDGKSDDSLKATWDGVPFGTAKLRQAPPPTSRP